MQKHFITSLGTGSYKPAIYSYNNEFHKTAYAPVAVAKIKKLAGAKVTILVTEKAREKHYDKLAAELTEIGLCPCLLLVPEGKNEAEFLDIFSQITENIAKKEKIVLDVTFGLRHLPFIYLAAFTYLVGLRQVELEGIYYGAYELRGAHELREEGEEIAPILEFTTIFRLTEWYYSLTAASQAGDFRPLGKMLRGDTRQLFESGYRDKAFSKAASAVKELGGYLASTLPLETGLKANEIVKLLTEIDSKSFAELPAANLALKDFKKELGHWEICGVNDKEGIKLTQEELERQLRLIDWYIMSTNLPAALLIMREWLVSRLQLAAGHCEDWLGYNKRKKYERVLNIIKERDKKGQGTELERKMGQLWQKVATQRNKLAHIGMDKTRTQISTGETRNLLNSYRELLEENIPEKILQYGEEHCLVTPLGLSKGVLYSAIKTVNPDRLVIITSAEAKGSIPEILKASGRSDLLYEIIELKSPHHGFKEVKDIIVENQELINTLANVRKVTVNITGGTTALQYVVEKLAKKISQQGGRGKKVALVDKRLYEEQRKNPFVCGELVELESLT